MYRVLTAYSRGVTHGTAMGSRAAHLAVMCTARCGFGRLTQHSGSPFTQRRAVHRHSVRCFVRGTSRRGTHLVLTWYSHGSSAPCQVEASLLPAVLVALRARGGLSSAIWGPPECRCFGVALLGTHGYSWGPHGGSHGTHWGLTGCSLGALGVLTSSRMGTPETFIRYSRVLPGDSQAVYRTAEC
jgi:hypothetical protein